MKTVLYVTLCFNLFLFSCERAVLDKKSSISIFLPGDSSVLQSITDPLNSVSLYSNGDGGGEEFNSLIMPTFGVSSAFPVNCYLVAVTAQTSESVFSKNYCGKKSTVTGRIDPEFKFGPYMGLVKAGTNFEIEVPAGTNRKIYVFALHAQNPEACKILTSGQGENPSKENFSRPHLVGTSSVFAVLPGQTTEVPLTLTQPVAAAAIDDCVLTSLGNSEQNVANAVAIERNSFPENTLVTARVIGDLAPSSYRCDYVDIVPKYKYSVEGNSRFKSARFDSQKEFTVGHDAAGGTNPTFRSKYDCENNINSSINFSIFPSDIKVRRWFILDYNFTAGINANFRATTTDGTIVSPNKLFKLISGRVPSGVELTNSTNYYRGEYDISIPKKIVAGQCYEVYFVRKTLEGFPVVDGTVTSTFTINQSPAGSAQFFYFAGCSSPVGATNILNATFFTKYYFKATQTFELTAIDSSGFTTAIESSAPAKIEVVASSSNTQPEFVDISASDIYNWHATLGCQPITFRMKNKDGVVVPMPSNSGYVEVLFGQSDPFNANQFSPTFTCASNYLNPGSAQLSVPLGAELFKIYINNNSATTEGLKTVRFKVFDGTKYYYLKHAFEVVKPNF